MDFIAIHWYASTNVASFLTHIDAVYAKYGLPIWVTEMNCADWSGSKASTFGYSLTSVKAFMKGAFEGMDARSYVERYTWKNRACDDIYMGSGCLWNLDGSLTELGQYYSNY